MHIFFSQLHEVLKLLNELLPPLAGVGEHTQELASDKEKILKDQPELLRQFGVDILPALIQVGILSLDILLLYAFPSRGLTFLLSLDRWLVLVQT